MSFYRLNTSAVRLYTYFLEYKWTLGAAGLFLIGSAGMSSAAATLLGKLTDQGFYGSETWVVWAAPAALIGVTLFYAVCTVMSTYLMARISQSVLVTLRTSLFERMLHWPVAAFQSRNSGEIGAKFVNEASLALGGAAESVIVLVRDSVQIIALLGVLCWHNAALTFVTLLLVPALALILRRLSKRMKRIVSESQKTMGEMVARVQESYRAEETIKVCGTAAYEAARFDDVSGKLSNLAVKTARVQNLGTPMSQLITMTTAAVIVAVALLEASEGLLTIGEFVTFLAALLLLKAPIQHLGGLSTTFAEISAAAESLFEMFDTPIECDNGTLELVTMEKGIRFDHVSLRYPNASEDALKDVCVTVKKGEKIALVGESGAGKSTFVSLLPRFREASEGAVTLDGKPIQNYTLKSLRKAVACVSQNVVLFDGTLKKNIIYGREDASDEEVRTAIDSAALGDFVQSLPLKLDTPVGEGGCLLSGGQKQRVAIARAFLKNAPILILDEASSALDAESEAKVREATERLMTGRTVFIVTHRFSSMGTVDRVLVFGRGRIVEEGTPEELRKQNGIYARLLALQTEGLKTENHHA